MSRSSRTKQDLKSKRDAKHKQTDTSETDEKNEPGILSNLSEASISTPEKATSSINQREQPQHVSESSPTSSRSVADTANKEWSPSRKRPPVSPNELIGYVESITLPKRNRRDTTDYSDIVLQVDGGNKRRAICFSNSKGKLLIEKKNNRTAVKFPDSTWPKILKQYT